MARIKNRLTYAMKCRYFCPIGNRNVGLPIFFLTNISIVMLHIANPMENIVKKVTVDDIEISV
jgi:hypothetical protein